MAYELNYLGGAAQLPDGDKTVQRRITRFLATANLKYIGDYIIDVDNIFKRRFMCCRENCDFYVHRTQDSNGLFGGDKIEWVDKGCCQGGSLEIPDELIANIDAHLDGIMQYVDDVCKQQILKRGWKKKISKELTGVGYLTKDNRCLFTFVGDNDMPLCALHKYAEKNNLNVLDFKPFECFMYPFDFIEVDDKILITTIDGNGSTQNFVRWGDVHFAQGCQCRFEHGLPMYQYGKDVIVRVLGKRVYEMLDKEYKSSFGGK